MIEISDRLKEKNHYYIPVGIFDNNEGLVFDLQVFIEEKPEYYSFANETKSMTGEELFAMGSILTRKEITLMKLNNTQSSRLHC